jgi:flagellar assembly factor FliW
MQIHTTRFGTLEVADESLTFFPQGLIGFETLRQWVLVADPNGGEVAWLQSASLGSQALPLISPRRFAPDYRVSVSRRELAPLKLRSGDRTYVLTLIAQANGGIVTNLRAPVIINVDRKLGCQVVTNDAQPLRFALPVAPTKAKAAAPASVGKRAA